MERNVHGAWVVWGVGGIKQYYGYTKKQARDGYIKTLNVYYNEEVKR
jgi:hypothetical protein